MDNLTPVVAYVRVSSPGQEDGDGIPRQVAAITLYCEKNGYEIVRIFREVKTGTSDSDERPAMSEMLEFLRTHDGECRIAVIERLDRLARDLVIQEGIIGKFQRLNLSVVSTCEPDLCSNDPSRKFVRQILGAVAELDRSLIVAKLKSARDRKRLEEGRCEGRKPYGVDDNERKVLEEIKRLKTEGVNVTAIASWLNASGVKPRIGYQWHPATISKICKRVVRDNPQWNVVAGGLGSLV